MDFLVEVIFANLIINFLGLNTRYYFFKLIGQEKERDYLSGEKTNYDSTDKISQHVFNIIIGLIVLALISFTVAYLVFGDW
jgi:hypothetical protein